MKLSGILRGTAGAKAFANNPYLKPYKPNAMATPLKHSAKGLLSYTYHQVPEVHVLLKFMMIPGIGASIFAVYNFWNYDVWFDKRTEMKPNERMTSKFRSSPRYANYLQPHPLDDEHERRIEETRTWGVQQELARQKREFAEKRDKLAQQRKNEHA